MPTTGSCLVLWSVDERCVFQDKDNRFNVQVKLTKCGLSEHRSCLKEVTLYINSNNEVGAHRRTHTFLSDLTLQALAASPPGDQDQVLWEGVCEQHRVPTSPLQM